MKPAMKPEIFSTVRAPWAGFLVVAAACVFGAGCGSGGGKAPAPSPTASTTAALTGRATLTIKWPAPAETRLIPDRSNSILLTLVRSGASGDETVATQLVPRPADVSVPTQVTFDRLPIGVLSLRASAYPNANGTGVAQSAGSVSVEISNAAVTDFGTLTLDSTIASVTVAPPGGSAAFYPGGPTQQWMATPRDASGAIVLVNPAKQTWASANTAVAVVNAATGVVTPVGSGTTTITETDSESGKSGSAPVTVAALGSLVVTVPVQFAGARDIQMTVGSTIRTVGRYNNEPSVTYTFTGLAPAAYTVTVKAFQSTLGGTGVPLATGSAPATIPSSGGSVPVSVPLTSNIRFTAIDPNYVSLSQNQTKALRPQAFDLTGGSIEGGQYTWVSSNPACVTVAPNGNSLSPAVIVTAVAPGSALITQTETETGKTARVLVLVGATTTGSLKAQFNPSDPVYVAGGSAGGLTLNDGHTYQFNTSANSAPTLTDTTTNTVVATGQYVTQSFSTERISTTYAVFDFAQDIRIGSGSVVSGFGANPLVLLTQSNVLMDGNAALSVSASGVTPGAGGSGPNGGPGAGTYVASPGSTAYRAYYGGGSFGGSGGANGSYFPLSTSAGPVYGSDFARGLAPHLQGGSGGFDTTALFNGAGGAGGAGGGALYLAAQGAITVNSAKITARGGDGWTGGSGGGIILLGRTSVAFTQATVDAGGGQGGFGDFVFLGGGGGGQIFVGYGGGAGGPSMTLVKASGGPSIFASGNYPGRDGIVFSTPFGGF